MLVTIIILYQKIDIISNNSKLLDSYIVNNIRYFSYFKNCLDGTYLLAYLLAIIRLLYQNQKG